jgi:hypothetical protein
MVMKKVKVEAKQVLADINSGMTDVALMEKYRLSALGLKSLFRKLGDMGLIRQLDAREVLHDLRSGMRDMDLMLKYHLSEKALNRLFVEIDRAGLSTESTQTEDLPETVTLRVTEIADAVRSGMTRAALKKKFRLSERGLKWLSSILVSEGVLSWQEVYENICTGYDDLVLDKFRQHKRYKARYALPVRQADLPEVVGSITDLSKKGLSVRGLEAKAGEIKNLVVPSDYFGEFGTFMFDAQCRWVNQDRKGEYIAGFEISHISIPNMVEFEILLKLLRASHR